MRVFTTIRSTKTGNIYGIAGVALFHFTDDKVSYEVDSESKAKTDGGYFNKGKFIELNPNPRNGIWSSIQLIRILLELFIFWDTITGEVLIRHGR